MFKVNNRSTGCHSGVFITNFEYYLTCCSSAYFAKFEHVMVDGILHCLNLNLCISESALGALSHSR